MNPPKVLIIAEAANPSLTSAALVGWSCARAVAAKVDAHIVTHWRNRDDFLQAGLIEGEDFTAIDTRRSQHLAWRLTKLLSHRDAFSWSLYAVFSNLVYPFFEREVWRQFRGRLENGEFDIVHRILPLSPTSPSPIAKPLKKIGVPFVLGPLNGGVSWPKSFPEVRRAERDIAGYLRPFYRLMPGVHSAQRFASAIIAGSRATLAEIPQELRQKCILIPENAIDPDSFNLAAKPARLPGPLRISFVGRLVALKGVDMLVEAAIPMLRYGTVALDIVGDGPEYNRLKSQLEDAGIDPTMVLSGWVEHGELQGLLQNSDLFIFPSIREFGGGAVLEAMALGVAPVVLDHGGPPELTAPGTGFIVPLKDRKQVVDSLHQLIRKYVDSPEALHSFGRNAQKHVSKYFTWEAKADQILEVYRWLLGDSPHKPGWGNPMGWPEKKKVSREKAIKPNTSPVSP